MIRIAESQINRARGIPVLSLLSELSDNPRGDSGDPGDGSHLVTGTEMAALAQKEPMLDKAVKTPCAESRLCVWGHTGIPGIPHRPEAYGEPRGHALERQRATSPIVEVFGS